MRSPITGIAALFVLFVVLIVGYSSVFTVSQTEQVLVVRLGEPVKVVTEPGLNFKAPFIDTVISIDKRILDLENSSQEVIASDQKRLVVDAFARYRIHDALRFYQTVSSVEGANSRLSPLLNSALRRVLGEATLTQLVRDERAQLMTRVREQLEREAQEFRSQGTQKAQEIRARADRDVTVVVADATSKSEQTRGEGDAERNRIFAEAYGKDADFFSF